MLDLRPVGYVIGLLVASLGITMLAPLGADLMAGNGHWPVFMESAIVTILTGGLLAGACANGVTSGLSLRQTFLLTSLVWLTLPVFGAIPFVIGATNANFTDAFFEAMSGLTTTGATVFSGLEALPEGLKLWRGILQWLGGVGIIVVAMVFLPELRVGGMQIFRTEGFDTAGKILPRAGEIASSISVIYVSLTIACAIAYTSFGMPPFDALTHAMTTVSTGGMANQDISFGAYGMAVHYTAVFFMILAALPFVRYVQLLAGTAGTNVPRQPDPDVFHHCCNLRDVDFCMGLGPRRYHHRKRVSQCLVQRHVHHFRDRVFQRGLYDLGHIPCRDVLFHRPDWRLRGVNGLLGKSIPLSIIGRVDQKSNPPDPLSARVICAAL